MGSITPVPLSILRIRQFSTFPPALKQEVEPIETGGESTTVHLLRILLQGFAELDGTFSG